MFENKKFHDEHENGIKHLHAMNKISGKENRVSKYENKML